MLRGRVGDRTVILRSDSGPLYSGKTMVEMYRAGVEMGDRIIDRVIYDGTIEPL